MYNNYTYKDTDTQEERYVKYLYWKQFHHFKKYKVTELTFSDFTLLVHIQLTISNIRKVTRAYYVYCRDYFLKPLSSYYDILEFVTNFERSINNERL